MNFDIKCSLLVIGTLSVGKTSILSRFTKNSFNMDYITTVGIDYVTKDIKINNKIIHVKIWDTSGQERFKSITKNYFRNVEGIIIVYAVDMRESFDQLKDWINSIEANIDLKSNNIPIIIIGNKIDKEEERDVNEDEAKNFAKNYNYPYFEVSAKTGKGIDDSINYHIVIEHYKA